MDGDVEVRFLNFHREVSGRTLDWLAGVVYQYESTQWYMLEDTSGSFQDDIISQILICMIAVVCTGRVSNTGRVPYILCCQRIQWK